MPLYEDTLAYLYSRLPMFSKDGSSALKKGLDNIRLLCAALGHPQDTFPAIHIAGTNGKGSVSHLLAAAFQYCGYKTGLYTSPHLIDFRERFRIDGQLVDKEFVVSFVANNKNIIEQIQPSYFELTVAMAFCAFAKEKVDIAIIETGLGGRLDSTNIIIPELSVITQIGWDHMDVLGNSLEAIAGEKAGIIKNNVPVVIGERQEETASVFLEAAEAHHAAIVFAENFWEVKAGKRDDFFQNFRAINRISPNEVYDFKTDLKGSYQKANLKTVIAAVQILQQKSWILPWEKVLESFSKVRALTGLHGRWEQISDQPKIILEVAHNVGGLAYLSENLQNEHLNPKGELKILCGFVKDKDISGILKLLPKEAQYYFTQANIPRALAADVLFEKASAENLSGTYYADIKIALSTALKALKKEDMLLITGSFFIVGEVAAMMKQEWETTMMHHIKEK